jgi:transposase
MALVAAVRGGASQRSVAARFGVGLGTVQRALARARGRTIEDVDWADRSTAPHRTRRTDGRIEALVLETRQGLADGILGESGAVAIRQTLIDRGEAGVPAVRTIGRILERRGILDGICQRSRAIGPSSIRSMRSWACGCSVAPTSRS